jgi:hypothetical protein
MEDPAKVYAPDFLDGQAYRRDGPLVDSTSPARLKARKSPRPRLSEKGPFRPHLISFTENLV